MSRDNSNKLLVIDFVGHWGALYLTTKDFFLQKLARLSIQEMNAGHVTLTSLRRLKTTRRSHRQELRAQPLSLELAQKKV